MNQLTGKVIVITGGAGLIGQSFVKATLEHGAKVVIAEKDIQAANVFVDSLSRNDNLMVQAMDITCTESIKSAMNEIHKKFGQIDALVNNAYPRNKNYGADFFEVTYEDFSENISMNLGGYFICSQQFAKYFQKQGYGNIINIASIYGCIAPKFDIYDGLSMTMPVEYAAIKSALIHLSKFMAKAFKGMNIRVNCLSPGGIYDGHSEQFSNSYANKCLNKGMLAPGDMDGSLVFLLSDASTYVNGHNLVVDDGFIL
jgi:NAD(P)-dependent dehydrogenase (short-subunit alcohol dehydrogenase family)